MTTAEAVTTEINPNYNPHIEEQEVVFKFREKEDKLGNKSKRANIELKLPFLSIEGIVHQLQQGGPGLELIKEAVANIVRDRASDLISTDTSLTAATFPFAELDWNRIAILPKAERRGGGIAKEEWEAFGADYQAVMPSITGKDAGRIEGAVKILLQKFSLHKGDKPVIKLLRDQVELYSTSAPSAGTYSACVQFLIEKANTLLQLDTIDAL